MDLQTLFTYAGSITWSTVAFFITWKIGIPLTKLFVDYIRNRGLGSVAGDLSERIETLKNNHIEHLDSRIASVERNYEKFEVRLDTMQNDISSLKVDVGIIKGRSNGTK